MPPLAWAILTLILVPTVVFAGADALGGHLLLSGDNLIQSYPLRVLVGSDIRHGILPSFDPWIWSGTPLLAALNAGAFYPTTLLFAVANPHVAWVIGEIFIFSSVGVGTCLLFSESGMSPFASFLGAAVFAFGGAVATQASVHTDMAEGLASLPWVLLALRRIAVDGRWRWSVLLGLSFALTVLAGAPEAMLDIALLALTYAVLRWSIDPKSWRRLISRAIVAAALTVGLTAALWVPAAHFIAVSQRGSSTLSFASGYAFPPWAGLLAVIPYLEGGFGLFAQPDYFGRSNLGELGCYVGILPIIAVLSLWTRTWRARLPKGEQRCWYGILLVGVVLAVGAGTPLEHVLFQIPLYGKQRDSGRNIVDVDLAASALFAWWVDGGSHPITARLRTASLAALSPLGLVVAVGTWFAISPSSLWSVLGAFRHSSSSNPSIAAAIALAAGLAAVAAAVVWARGRLARRTWLIAVTIFVLVDLALFACGSSYVFSEAAPTPSSSGPVISLVKANLSPSGRYAFYDPYLFDPSELVAAGEPDIGILNGIKSFSGYGSSVDATYSARTDTHLRGGLNQLALMQGELDPLGVQVVVTVPEEFLVPIAQLPDRLGRVVQIAEAPGVDPALPGGSVPTPELLYEPLSLSPAHAVVTETHILYWFFGTTLRPTSAVLVLELDSGRQRVRVGLVEDSGGVAWQPQRRIGHGNLTVTLPLSGKACVGLEVQLLGGDPLGPASLAVKAAGRSYLVSGELAQALTPKLWTDVGQGDDFTVFRSRVDPQPTWVQPATITSSVPGAPTRVPSTSFAASGAVVADSLEIGSARVVASSPTSATIDVRTPKAGLLAWSTAFDQGWKAEITPKAGPTRPVKVQRDGLVMDVPVPKGTSVVHFNYLPVGFRHGVALSLVTFFAWIVATAGFFVFSRRRRHLAVKDVVDQALKD